MDAVKWKTGITKVAQNKIVTRGYPQDELIGKVPFSHVVFLLLKGELPEENEAAGEPAEGGKSKRKKRRRGRKKR